MVMKKSTSTSHGELRVDVATNSNGTLKRTPKSETLRRKHLDRNNNAQTLPRSSKSNGEVNKEASKLQYTFFF